jgi:RNA polymerase sigma-70 factor, ECF subfamily
MGLAYRMLGSLSEAEDAVQDVSLRWLRVSGSDIRSVEAWLVSVTTRLCIDRLRHLESEKAAYTGFCSPQPILGEAPETILETKSDVSMALLVLLQRLSPDERAVFVLHDVLDREFEEVAECLGKSAVACRQMARRAREHLRQNRARFPTAGQVHQELVERFMGALQSGSKEEVLSVLAPEATLVADGGGKFKVSRTGIQGSDRIARLIAYARLIPRALRSQSYRISSQIAAINGEPGILTFLDDTIIFALAFEVNAFKIMTIYMVLDPAKLAHSTRSQHIVGRNATYAVGLS